MWFMGSVADGDRGFGGEPGTPPKRNSRQINPVLPVLVASGHVRRSPLARSAWTCRSSAERGRGALVSERTGRIRWRKRGRRSGTATRRAGNCSDPLSPVPVGVALGVEPIRRPGRRQPSRPDDPHDSRGVGRERRSRERGCLPRFPKITARALLLFTRRTLPTAPPHRICHLGPRSRALGSNSETPNRRRRFDPALTPNRIPESRLSRNTRPRFAWGEGVQSPIERASRPVQAGPTDGPLPKSVAQVSFNARISTVPRSNSRTSAADAGRRAVLVSTCRQSVFVHLPARLSPATVCQPSELDWLWYCSSRLARSRPGAGRVL